MTEIARNIIATLGGSTAVSRMTAAPVSTVHSWKHNGIPPSRLAHLKLVAEKEGIAIDWATGLPPEAEEASSSSENGTEWPIAATGKARQISVPAVCGVCERRADDPAVPSCTAIDCGLAAKVAA